MINRQQTHKYKFRDDKEIYLQLVDNQKAILREVKATVLNVIKDKLGKDRKDRALFKVPRAFEFPVESVLRWWNIESSSLQVVQRRCQSWIERHLRLDEFLAPHLHRPPSRATMTAPMFR